MDTRHFLSHRLPRHRVPTPLVVACLGFLLTALAAFAPASPSPTVWVAQDATAAMQCTTHTTLHATTSRAVTTATHPCAAGTILRLVATTKAAAIATQEAYVTTPTGPAAQGLLHPQPAAAVGTHPSVICSVATLCGGGGGGGSSPCDQQITWIDAAGQNTAFTAWYSTWGTSDCRAFEVFSLGIKLTWVRPAWWPFTWNLTWTYDNGAWVNHNLATSSWTTRSPYYWVGPGGSSEQFHEWGGWSSDDFAIQFTPR